MFFLGGKEKMSKITQFVSYIIQGDLMSLYVGVFNDYGSMT